MEPGPRTTFEVNFTFLCLRRSVKLFDYIYSICILQPIFKFGPLNSLTFLRPLSFLYFVAWPQSASALANKDPLFCCCKISVVTCDSKSQLNCYFLDIFSILIHPNFWIMLRNKSKYKYYYCYYNHLTDFLIYYLIIIINLTVKYH